MWVRSTQVMGNASVTCGRSDCSESQPHAVLRKLEQFDQVLIVDIAVDHRVVAHRRFYDSIVEFDTTQLGGIEQQGRAAIFLLDTGEGPGSLRGPDKWVL